MIGESAVQDTPFSNYRPNSRHCLLNGVAQRFPFFSVGEEKIILSSEWEYLGSMFNRDGRYEMDVERRNAEDC